MDEQPLSATDARTLRFLRMLVLVLTSTMIVGMVVLVILFATRFPGKSTGPVAPFDLPETLVLPDGVQVSALTRTSDAWVVVSDAGGIFFFALTGGTPVRHIPAVD